MEVTCYDEVVNVVCDQHSHLLNPYSAMTINVPHPPKIRRGLLLPRILQILPSKPLPPQPSHWLLKLSIPLSQRQNHPPIPPPPPRILPFLFLPVSLHSVVFGCGGGVHEREGDEVRGTDGEASGYDGASEGVGEEGGDCGGGGDAVEGYI